MRFNFKGKNILISGGTHGIGLSCAEQFLKLGGKVITFSRDENKINLTKNNLISLEKTSMFKKEMSSMKVSYLISQN